MTTETKNNNKGMKKGLFIMILFVIGFFFGAGMAHVAKAQGKNNSLLWKISGNGLEKPSYIYGTIHITCEETFNMSDEVKEAFNATDLTVLELDMDDPNLMPTMQKISMNPGMENISAKIEEKDKAIINEFFTANYGADLTQLGVMKPFVLMSMVTLKTITCKSKSFEDTFVAMSKEASREVEGLETAEFQISVFDNIPQKELIGWITEGITKFDEQSEMLSNMMELHNKNDLKGLSDLILQDPQFANYADALLYDRNADWIPKIEEKAKAQPTFFAVGAGHLGTDKGVIALLKKKGYKVKAISY